MSEITVKLEVSDQLCADVMCTALEGGIGYWCSADKIQRRPNGKMPDAATDRWDYVYFDAFDAESGERFGQVTYDTIRSGIERILSGPAVRRDLREQIYTNVLFPIESMDSEAADVVVQVGLFGKVIYG